MADKKEKKKSGSSLFIIIILIIAIILLFIWKGGFGLGGGSGSGLAEDVGSGENAAVTETSAAVQETEPEETEASQPETADEASGSTVVIEISEDKLIADGNVLSDSAALKEYILSVKTEESSFVLRDNRALKSAYDEAKSVLDRLGCEYTEETA